MIKYASALQPLKHIWMPVLRWLVYLIKNSQIQVNTSHVGYHVQDVSRCRQDIESISTFDINIHKTPRHTQIVISSILTKGNSTIPRFEIYKSIDKKKIWVTT